MVSVKRVLSVILVLTISILIGCSKVKDDNEVSLDLFDVFKGKELATNYLINIRNDDIEKANEICVRELVDNNVNVQEALLYALSYNTILDQSEYDNLKSVVYFKEAR